MSETLIPEVIRTFTASELKTGGAILDAARDGMVAIKRRAEEYVLMRRTEFETRIAEAADPTPKTLADLLRGYDRDAGQALLSDWMADAPKGPEIL